MLFYTVIGRATRFAVVATSLCVSVGLAACSSDSGEDDTGSDPSAGGEGGGGGGDAVSCEDDVLGCLGIDETGLHDSELIYRDVEAAYETVEECKAFDSRWAESRNCTCDNCFEIMQRCDSLQGCIEGRQCTSEVGCNDEFECYLVPIPGAERCAEIIDRYGNASVSVALMVQTQRCAVENGCPLPSMVAQ